MLAMAGAYLTYFVIFVAVSLVVSAKAPSSRLALLVLMSFWFITCLVAPRLMADVARHAVYVPSTIEFLQRVDEDRAKMPTDWQKRVTAQLMRQYGVQKEEDLPVDPLGAHLIEGDKIESTIYERHFNELFDVYGRQDRIYRMGAFLAPMLAIQPLSMGLAGTDFNHHNHFWRALSKYRQDWLDILNADILHNRRPGELSYARGRDLWAQVPDMNYQPPGLLWTLNHYRMSIGLLAGWTAAMLVAASFALKHVEIE
jgi:ABC-2 type transport system permease protein